MTQRDQKTLMIILASVGGVGVAFWLLYSWFLSPVWAYDMQIQNLDGEVETKEQQITGVIRDRKLVEKAKTQSLASSQVRASADYDQYLKSLLQFSGLTNVDITDPPPPVDAKIGPAAAANGQKKAAHIVLTYGVHAKGTLASVVKALENLQKTPVKHRVRSLEVGRQNNTKELTKDDLNVSMSVEAMIVAGTKPDYEAKLEPNSGLKLPTAANPRRYDYMARKNIFIGFLPAEAYVSNEAEEIENIIPEYVRLVTTDPTAGEAWLRNLLFRTRETRLRDKKVGGFNIFQITNEDRSKVLIKGTVLRVDQRDVYFQVKEDVYDIHIGETVTHAMRRSLSSTELRELNLTALVQPYDPTSDTTSKSGGKKGSTNKGGRKKS